MSRASCLGIVPSATSIATLRRSLRQHAYAPALVCNSSRKDSACAASTSGHDASSTSLSLSVYIEDTDHYQVAFYANYLKWFLRAREAAVGADGLRQLRLLKLRPAVLRVDKAKYNSAARLGDAIEIVSTVSQHTRKSLRWQQSAMPVGTASTKPFVAADIVVGFLASDGSLADVPDFLQSAADPLEGPTQPLVAYPDLKPISVTPVQVFSDEVSPWGFADEVSVLRWFERNRTDSIGGAAGLRALEASGILVVVTGIADLRLDPGAGVGPGDMLSVRSGVELKRKNTIVVFKQELWRGSRLVAQGEVACASISAVTMKLTPCPPELAQRLSSAPAAADAAAVAAVS